MYSATPQSVMSQQVFCDGKECKFVSVVEIVASLDCVQIVTDPNDYCSAYQKDNIKSSFKN